MTDVLRGIAFAKGDTSIGIAVGNYGTILRTTNGGANWVSVVTNGDRTLNGVAFADPVTAYAVGVVGTILKTTDAGVTWSAMNSGTTNMLNSVSFADTSNGVAVGEKGIILQTQTGGVFWGKRSVIPAQDNEFFRSVSFCDRRHAFISAWMGQYATTDGGENWHILPGASDSIESPVGQGISFADSLHGGYVWGDKYNNGYVQHTTDGGKTYHLIYPTGSKTHILRGIQYSDTNRVTVVGDGGYIAHSTDGGKTWTEQESNTLNNLLAVSFGSVQAGTAVGNRGNIVRITTNEKPLPTQSVQSAAESPKIVLDQNYPNPFNSFTTIHYVLPRPGYTLIEFFTIEGNRVRQVQSGYEPSGDHSVRFDASDLASGVYLCRVSNGGLSAEMNVQLVR